jgi:hypothetical protein
VVAEDTFITSRQADAFAGGVFRSNEAEVIREMDAFLAHLH